MEFTSSLLLDKQQYVLLLAVVMAISFIAKKTQVFLPFYAWIARTVKSKRAVVALISAVSGVLPISGRVAVSAGALDTQLPQPMLRREKTSESLTTCLRIISISGLHWRLRLLCLWQFSV